MELIFTKTTVGGKEVHVAEFTAQGAMNVHFERNDNSTIVIRQRISDSVNWVKLKSYENGSAPSYFEENFVSDVYPINFRIESYSPVTNALLTEA